MTNRDVIYTAIFGGYDTLHEPTYVPDGFDFVCFTDSETVTSDIWQIRRVTPAYTDPTRNARMYKILPHRYLGGYDTSIWVDGNVLVHGDVRKLVDEYLDGVNMAVYDHAYARHRNRDKTPDVRRSIYEEAEQLLVADPARGRMKDDPEIIRKQINYYKEQEYPGDNGLLLSMVLLRKHNEHDVIETMEFWWDLLKRFSKRDQLSFNFAAWKTGLAFTYIRDNVRDNDFFLRLGHTRSRKGLFS